MRVTQILPNLAVPDIESAREFYAGYLGLTSESLSLGWVSRFTSPDTGAAVQLVTKDETSPVDSVLSIKVDDVDEAYRLAQGRGYEIVHPLQDEAWGPRRFFVRAPDGNVINMVQHHEG